MEHEHISTYKTFEQYQKAFAEFFQGMKDPKVVVAHTSVFTTVGTGIIPKGALSYGLNREADVVGRLLEHTREGSKFEIQAPRFGIRSYELHLSVPGTIHVENAVGAIALSLAAGVEIGAAAAGLATFRGLKSRFEIVRSGSFTTILDYAHTPHRIQPVIEQTRELFPGMRVLVLFEPHLYSRTKQFLDGFKHALSQADRAYVTDIFPSREARSNLKNKVHAQSLADGAEGRVTYAGSLDQGIEEVVKTRTERDIVLVLGAGPIQYRARRLVEV